MRHIIIHLLYISDSLFACFLSFSDIVVPKSSVSDNTSKKNEDVKDEETEDDVFYDTEDDPDDDSDEDSNDSSS